MLDLLLPPQCAACDRPVHSQGQLCAGCFGAVTFVAEPFCARCGVPFASDGQAGFDRVCQACRQAPPGFRQAHAALVYDKGARRLILPFKHGDRAELAAVLAPHMIRNGRNLLERADVLVPIPLHRRRLFLRRYNQAAVLARAVAATTGHRVVLDGLRRTRATPALGHLGMAERAATVAGVFAVRLRRMPAIRGRTVLLIDDVMTSGATVNEAARVLLAAGAAAVDVLVAARVPDPRA